MSGFRLIEAPPITAQSDSPERRLWQAKLRPISDVEQPVSIAVLGPLRSKK